MSITIDCYGFLADVEIDTGSGTTTFYSPCRVIDSLVSGAVDLAGDEFSVYDNLELGGSPTTLVTVSGDEQRIDNMQIDPTATTGTVLTVSGDENRIRGQIQEAKDNIVSVTGDDNDIDLTMTATVTGGNTPDGVNISGDRNKVEGLLRHKGGVAMTNGVVLTAAADSNWVCIHQTGTITTAYTDSGTNNDRCAGASEIVGRKANTTRVTSTPYNVLVTDEVLFVNTDAAARTVNLPAGVEGTHYKIINTGTSGNDVTVDGNGAETVWGGLTLILTDGDIVDLHYNATDGWW